jgi:hypothetical protein
MTLRCKNANRVFPAVLDAFIGKRDTEPVTNPIKGKPSIILSSTHGTFFKRR